MPNAVYFMQGVGVLPLYYEGIRLGVREGFMPFSMYIAQGFYFYMDNRYYAESISFQKLYKSMKRSCKNVRWKDSVISYESNGLKNTYLLRRRHLNGKYRISRYQTLLIREPKERLIKAARIVDRQFQRSLCDSGLYKDITEHFVRDNVACQIGRGTSDAFRRLKKQLSRYFSKYGNCGWVVKMDVHHFFNEIPHDLLKEKLRKYISDPDAIKLLEQVIDSYDE